jgi:hypothetical protein
MMSLAALVPLLSSSLVLEDSAAQASQAPLLKID